MLNTQEYRDAVAYKGDAPIFTVAYDWQDKPHRLVYDLCDEVDALRAQVAMLTAILRDIADCEDCEGCEHIPADALAGLERERKRAAAIALDGRAADLTAIADLPRRCSQFVSRENIARAIFLAAANNCRDCAAQLRKELEAGNAETEGW